MAMDKISKEELKNLIGGKALSDEELEMVAGGEHHSCYSMAQSDYLACLHQDDIDNDLCALERDQFLAECVD